MTTTKKKKKKKKREFYEDGTLHNSRSERASQQAAEQQFQVFIETATYVIPFTVHVYCSVLFCSVL